MLLHLEICQQSRPWECVNPEGIFKECGKGGKPASWLSMLSILCHFHSLLWTRVYGRGVDMVGQGVLETGDYGLVIAGSTQPVAAAYGSGTAALYMKVDAQGATGAGCLSQPAPVGTVFTLTSAISTTATLIAGATVTATVDAATIVSGTATTRAFACAYLPLAAR